MRVVKREQKNIIHFIWMPLLSLVLFVPICLYTVYSCSNHKIQFDKVFTQKNLGTIRFVEDDSEAKIDQVKEYIFAFNPNLYNYYKNPKDLDLKLLHTPTYKGVDCYVATPHNVDLTGKTIVSCNVYLNESNNDSNDPENPGKYWSESDTDNYGALINNNTLADDTTGCLKIKPSERICSDSNYTFAVESANPNIAYIVDLGNKNYQIITGGETGFVKLFFYIMYTDQNTGEQSTYFVHIMYVNVTGVNRTIAAKCDWGTTTALNNKDVYTQNWQLWRNGLNILVPNKFNGTYFYISGNAHFSLKARTTDGYDHKRYRFTTAWSTNGYHTDSVGTAGRAGTNYTFYYGLTNVLNTNSNYYGGRIYFTIDQQIPGYPNA